MNQKIKVIIGAVIFIVFIIGADRLLKNQNRGKMENLISSEEKNEESKVIEVTSNSFEKEVLQSEKRVLVDFYAGWCGPCQVLSPIIDKISTENNEVKFVRINVDDTEDIASKYGIYSIPTLVMIENGKEINRSIGLINEEELNSFINNK